MSQPDRHVASHLSLLVHQPLRIILQVAVSGMAPAGLQESIRVCCDGVPIAVTEVTMPHAARAHVFLPRVGNLTVDYSATVRGNAAPPRVSDADRIAYLRPSRYAESDRLGAIAHAEFAGIDGAAELLAAVSSWVGSRLRYVPGSSGPTDGAVDTLLQRQGVCRDYAHLVIAMLRALDVPARLAAVYAPGLAPMD
ncbi:MAG: transglutaminase family protein, partial [Jatrophihabitantaceae bacterium]